MPALQEKLQEFNETVERWISFTGTCSRERFYFQPSQGGWSIAQVYAHLIADTIWMSQQMQTALLLPYHTAETMKPEAIQMFQANSFPDLRIENPFNDPMITPPEHQQAAADALAHLRREINDLFDAHGEDIMHGKSAHPGLGYFTAAEWLQFATMHFRHHQRQKQRIEEEFYR
ncbi:DinB family protein [Flavihumibacter petaseus]|uniref:DinB-like domain-containing protein n=1 Tax=Flavihumibacter petaseus NBRC 106054 TaxID=1220578 RepID=A0A0E9N4W6_9BACT|nr:DinB family protein [Flavihumibacter petaseus]GAO44859.1 hypothetical protein FPE01S_04_01020 [Flavihumibacter petaseus NBRC 106054]